MGKYSSDSDSEKRKSYKSRSKYSSSDSRRAHKKKSTRSRSRDKYSRSRRSRSSSSTAHKSKSRRRSRSRDKARFRDRHHRSRSRSKYRRSRSRSYIREYSSRRRRSSSSCSSSEPKHDNVEENVVNEIRKSPELSKVDAKVLTTLNEDGFTPKAFTSSKSKKVLDNIVIDLRKQTIKVPEVEPVEPDSVFHHNLFLNEEARMEKWIKELYGYRQRALQQGLKVGDK